MTDQTESASEYAELLTDIECYHIDGSRTVLVDAIEAIRALEAKVAEREARCVELANWWNAASADCDRLAGEVERLMRAAKVADWEQVRLNGGPPCFHIEESEFRQDWAPDVLDYRFCFRAERWPGHPTLHTFVTLHDAIRAAKDGGNG